MKPLRAFPPPIQVGTDICRIARVHRILCGARGARLVRRICSPGEQTEPTGWQARTRADEAGGGAREQGMTRRDEGVDERGAMWLRATFLAGRFAAKEAAIKAFYPHRRLGLHDVVIEQRGASRAPVARIRTGDAEAEDVEAMVSISHDGEYATAVCVAYVGDEGR